MKVDVKTEGFQKKLIFTVPNDKVRDELDQAFRKLSRTARLPGFRQGKAPRRVLEARFGPQIYADVANDLIQNSYLGALSEHEIEPIGRPSVEEADELDPRGDFHFTIAVDVRPEIELTQYTGVEVGYPKAEVGDDEVEAAVRSRLEGQSRLVEVTDRAAQFGDLVLVELVAQDGEEVVAQEQGTMIRTEADPYYPGVEALVLGLSVGEEKEGEVSFDADARIEEVAGRTLQVKVKVHGIQANQVPELTDEIAEELGYEGGAQGMRDALRAQQQASRDELSRNQARANLLEKLIEINPFDVPDSMIEQSLEMLTNELKLQQAYRTGRDPRTISFSDATMADLRQRAVFASRAGLILEYVAKKEELEITDADIEAKQQEMADEQGQTIEAVKAYFQQEDALAELKDRLREEKTLDWLLERAELVETEATPPTDALGQIAEQIAQENAERKVARSAGAAASTEEAAAEAPAPAEVDLSVLNQAVGKLKEALATGDFDAHLDALEAAETAGKNRKGALEAIQARRG